MVGCGPRSCTVGQAACGTYLRKRQQQECKHKARERGNGVLCSPQPCGCAAAGRGGSSGSSSRGGGSRGGGTMQCGAVFAHTTSTQGHDARMLLCNTAAHAHLNHSCFTRAVWHTAHACACIHAPTLGRPPATSGNTCGRVMLVHPSGHNCTQVVVKGVGQGAAARHSWARHHKCHTTGQRTSTSYVAAGGKSRVAADVEHRE
jgi:hypothetical protein